MPILLLLLSLNVFATKPCFTPIEPCEDAKSCSKQASWIAVGTITNVVHKFVGMPMNKDFATFDLKVEKWEKPSKLDVKLMSLKVGWCTNRQEVPADLTKKFRFYGSGNPKSETPEYLFIEALK